MSSLCECGCGRAVERVGGRDRRFIAGHHRRGLPTKHYRKAMINGSLAALHRARAEYALGRPLPKSAPVHHADGSMSENAPLVICQDEGYHRLLHARMRVKAAGGDPNLHKICCRCKTLKLRSEFNRCLRNYDGLASPCRSCVVVINRQFRKAR